MGSSRDDGTEDSDQTKEDSKKCLYLRPPPRKGMTVLDKEAFRVKIPIPAIEVHVEDKLKSGDVFKILKPYLLKVKALKAFKEIEDQGRLVYLNPDVVGGIDEENLNELIEKFRSESSDPKAFQRIRLEDVEFSYDHWSPDEILESVLPDGMEKASGFSKAGHLLHLNLRDHLLPYKKLIGEVLLEKIPSTKTVVNKLNTIDSTYRNFEMEVLAGEADTVVTVKHSGCVFKFDFAKVYWNTRLASEHERIIKVLTPEDTLYDVFAGVGPFSVPAGKKKVRVLANDLNPESHRWLQFNIEKNKCSSFVSAYNLDGKDFIERTVKEDLKKFYNQYKSFHAVMNLPAIAVDFLSAFWSILEDVEVSGDDSRIIVHVYCFIKDPPSKDYKVEALELVRQKLGFRIEDDLIQQVFSVRNVAPNKEMIRVSFRLPLEVCKGGKRIELDGETVAKKAKLEEC